VKLFIKVFKNVAGVGICMMAICALQWLTQRLLCDTLPSPFQGTKAKQISASKLDKYNEAESDNKCLHPNRQDGKRYNPDNNSEDNSPDILFFSSTWTQFILLIKCILKRPIKDAR
jgi:hypothetical protein